MDRAVTWPGDRAISPVVGVMLLSAIVVLMAVVAGAMLVDLTGAFARPAPVAVTQESVAVETGGGTVENELTLFHAAGEELPADRTYLRVTAGGETRRIPLSETNVAADGDWDTGERLTLALNQSHVCNAGARQVVVNVVVESDGRTSLVESKEVPIERGQFEIRNGAVVPTAEYTAEVRLLGTAITQGAGGPPVPVSVEVSVGDGSTEPWPGDVNDGNNPRTWSVGGQDPGTEIVVDATADAGWFTRTVSSQHGNSDLVYVLRDGDEVPDVDSFGDQANAEAFLEPYLDDGTVTLADDEAIFLFELGASDPDSAAADFQDAVVVVSLDTEATVTVEDDDRTEVVCPAA